MALTPPAPMKANGQLSHSLHEAGLRCPNTHPWLVSEPFHGERQDGHHGPPVPVPSPLPEVSSEATGELEHPLPPRSSKKAQHPLSGLNRGRVRKLDFDLEAGRKWLHEHPWNAGNAGTFSVWPHRCQCQACDSVLQFGIMWPLGGIGWRWRESSLSYFLQLRGSPQFSKNKSAKWKKKCCLLVFIITYFHIDLFFSKTFSEDSVGIGPWGSSNASFPMPALKDLLISEGETNL